MSSSHESRVLTGQATASRTVGVLAGWQYYWTPTPLSYLEPVFHGICQAAGDHGCNVLLACGMGSSATPADPMRPAWPFPSPESDFVPVGPWNTDGLIVVNPLHTPLRSTEIQSVIAAGHPVTFIASGERGPLIVADNALGIRVALQHLLAHGHRQVAFIAGSPEDLAGDTGERLEAYRLARAELGLASDERLWAYGRHTYDGGYGAMRRVVEAGAPFTAVLASNDESALGALQALRDTGLRVPQDVAIIGFDDRPESALQDPPLTSVAVSLFELGYRAVEQVLRQIEGEARPEDCVRVPARLIVRESCGCGKYGQVESPARSVEAGDHAAQSEAGPGWRSRLLAAFRRSVERHDPGAFEGVLGELLAGAAVDGAYAAPGEVRAGDAATWNEALAVVREDLPAVARGWAGDRRQTGCELAAHAAAALAENTWRNHRRYAMSERWTADRLGLLTARLLNARDEGQVYEVLAEHLPAMGIESAVVGSFRPAGDDPFGHCELRTLAPAGRPLRQCATRQFPPEDLLPGGARFSLALLPLVNPRGQVGFVAFDAGLLRLYGSIVQELAAALYAAQLYGEAQEGRRLAEEANQMKSRFLSTVSHELRTPLNLIVGLSELMLQGERAAPGPGPVETRRDLERLHANAEHLGHLISDVLDLASSDAGRLRLSHQFVDLAQVLRVVAETGRRLAIAKGLSWSADLPESGPWVWGDRTRLSQVAFNLISNAVKFTAAGGVSIALHGTPEEVSFSVRDTGLGIPVDEQPHIFDEFRRTERSIDRGYGGLGLGLSICKRLIELHGGAIDFESTGVEGAGSTFRFTLPVVEAPAQAPVAPASEVRGGAPGILVLLAGEETSERLRQHLQERGFEVQSGWIDESASWHSRLVVNPPSAIVLDVSAGSDYGWTVLRMLKADPATRNIPVLFYALTPAPALPASGGKAVSAAVLELDYLTKPIELAELTRALDQHWLAPGPDQAARTFLVVDDDPDTLEMHARIVQSRSPLHRVLKARDGIEALEKLATEHVDLVLLDLMMPEMDGFAVLEAMRDRPTARDIPVIVVTGQTLSEAEIARLNRGVTKVLSKGVFSLEETLSHLDAALARRRELSSEAQRLVRQAMAYMQAHFNEPLTREEIARHVGLSDDYLTSCFHKELGLTPVVYLNRYRVQQARLLLKNTHQSITEIALQVGFASSSYFSRIFHRETGMSPAEYRRT